MAFHYGKCALYVSVLEMFFSPLVASLSDTFGRKREHNSATAPSLWLCAAWCPC